MPNDKQTKSLPNKATYPLTFYLTFGQEYTKNMIKTDVLIIGAGIAGLTTAIKLARKKPDLQITVLNKTKEGDTNTSYAQGGVAAVWDESFDSFEKHIADTLDAGDGLCDPEVVEIVVKEGPERVREIIGWGARFDKEDGREAYDLGREGGHSENRILHYKDATGWEIQRALGEELDRHPNITLHEHYFALDLITQHHLGYTITRVTPEIECYGSYVLNRITGEIETMLAKATVLCTGGAGQIYKNTTNPIIATGDGIAMTYRAKGRMENLEFVQFHPTGLYNPAGENPTFLISEAVRGEGAILRTKDGEEFMTKYDIRGSLAPRDIVARAIDKEMKMRGDECMYLDCTHLDEHAFTKHFPNIYEKCMSIGINPMQEMIPVTPVCHYLCGGILVDKMGRSSIQNLYACGECTSTGLHGANRLASNSLLEAMVFGHRIHLDLVERIDDLSWQDNIPEWDTFESKQPVEQVLITQELKELHEIMSYYVGIVRSNLRLKRAMDRLWILYRETEALYNDSAISPKLCELRNLITLAYLVSRSATMRRESRGLHFTTDYPGKLDFLDRSIL